jgi:uncharacterized membrane-anchored protein YjiN (DUF445 family)
MTDQFTQLQQQIDTLNKEINEGDTYRIISKWTIEEERQILNDSYTLVDGVITQTKEFLRGKNDYDRNDIYEQIEDLETEIKSWGQIIKRIKLKQELSTLLKTTWQMADYVLENINLEDDDNYELIGELQKIKSLCEQNLPELKQ